MLKQLKIAVKCTVILTALLGVVYPLAITGLAQAFFPFQANGSILFRDRTPVGSRLIGQPFDDPRYFWSRPSATTPPYDGASSSGSNFGPTNPDLESFVEQRIGRLRRADLGNDRPVPIDLVTASASGLDPDISPAAARYQVPRVARFRNIAPATLMGLVDAHTEQRFLHVLGEPRVNVLELNLDLDQIGSK